MERIYHVLLKHIYFPRNSRLFFCLDEKLVWIISVQTFICVIPRDRQKSMITFRLFEWVSNSRGETHSIFSNTVGSNKVESNPGWGEICSLTFKIWIEFNFPLFHTIFLVKLVYQVIYRKQQSKLLQKSGLQLCSNELINILMLWAGIFTYTYTYIYISISNIWSSVRRGAIFTVRLDIVDFYRYLLLCLKLSMCVNL